MPPRLPVVLASLALMGAATCGGDEPPGCRVAQQIDLPPSALTSLREVALHRIPDGFVLVGAEGDEVRWGHIAADGQLAEQAAIKLPPRVTGVGPWTAPIGKNVPGDQLAVVFAAPKAGAVNQLELRVLVQDRGGAAPAPARALADLPANVDPRIVRAAFGGMADGRRATFVWGFEGQPVSPSLLVLAGDAAVMGGTLSLYDEKDTPPPWSCLTMAPSRGKVAVSVLESPPGSRPAFHLFELREDGSRDFQVTLTLHTARAGCPVSAATATGYGLAWQNSDGTFFGNYDADRETVDSGIVVGANRFGGAAKQPRPSCIAAMGNEFGLGFAGSPGPQVWRFDVFGTKKGSTLFLRSAQGNVGPLASLSTQGALYVTYLDQVTGTNDGNLAGNQRYLVKVECPGAHGGQGGGSGN